MTPRFRLYFLALILLTWIPVIHAQQPKSLHRIGVLRVGKPPDPFIDAFRQGLQEMGYTEGKNIVIEYRWLQREDQLNDAAEELVRLPVDIIVATTTPAALAAKRATQSIPIIAPVMGDPIGSGLVKTFAHPGGNVTGLTNLAPELWPKRLELLQETVPKLHRVAMLWNTSNPAMALGAKETRVSAGPMKIMIQDRGAKNPNELENVFVALKNERPDGLLVMIDPFTNRHAREIIEFASSVQLPAMYDEKSLSERGGLLSYGESRGELFRRAASYVHKILRGTKPADLPVEQPMKFELVINLNTAKQIGLTIPPNVLARADRVIK